MSGEEEKKPEVKTEAEVNEQIDTELEAAADEAFGGEPIAADATKPVEDERTPEQIEADKVETARVAALSEEDKAAEAKVATEKADAEKVESDRVAALSPEAKEAEEKAAAEKIDAEDPYNIPEDAKGRTRERMEKLTGDLKTAHEEISKRDETLKGFKEVMDSTGMNPKEIQQTLNLGTLLKKDPAAALVTLKGVVADLSKQVGEVPPGEDPLEGFADLKQKVADRELTVDVASELARGRIKEKADKDKQARDLQAQQQQDSQQKTAEQEDTARSGGEDRQFENGIFADRCAALIEHYVLNRTS